MHAFVVHTCGWTRQSRSTDKLAVSSACSRTTTHNKPHQQRRHQTQALLEKSLFITNGEALEELDDDDGRGDNGGDGGARGSHDWAAAEDAEGGHHGGAPGGLSELEVGGAYSSSSFFEELFRLVLRRVQEAVTIYGEGRRSQW